MLAYVILLFACQLVGEIAAKLSGLPVPGSVIGMILLFLGLLIVRRRVPAGLDAASTGLLRYLLLLFVPAGVGLYDRWHLLTAAIIPIAAAILVGTILTIGITGVIMQFITRHVSRRDAVHPTEQNA